MGAAVTVAVVMVVVVGFGEVSGPEHVVFVELDSDVRCSRGARAFVWRVWEHAEEAL